MTRRKTTKQDRPRHTSYWTEHARVKMERWCNGPANGARLAALGVPLNLMTPSQRNDVLHNLPAGMRVSLTKGTA